MFDIIHRFMQLPFLGCVLFAGGVGWWTFTSDQVNFDQQAQIAQSLEAGAPPAVNLSDFQISEDVGPLREVRIEGWLGSDYNYQLVKSDGDGNLLTERYMYILFGRNDPEDAKFARAAMIMTRQERDYFSKNMGRYMSGVVNGRIKFRFSGEQRYNPILKERAVEVLQRERLWQGEDFIFVRPWLEGREVALTSKQAPVSVNTTGWGIAALAFLIGLGGAVASKLLGRNNIPIDVAGAKEAIPELPMEAASKVPGGNFIGKLRKNRVVKSEAAGLQLQENNKEAEKMSDALTKTRVLNQGKNTTGLIGFLGKRIYGIPEFIKVKLAGMAVRGMRSRKFASQRRGRPADPFERLRQDRLR